MDWWICFIEIDDQTVGFIESFIFETAMRNWLYKNLIESNFNSFNRNIRFDW